MNALEKQLLPLRRQAAMELYNAGMRDGLLSGQQGETVSSYCLRRGAWWIQLREMDEAFNAQSRSLENSFYNMQVRVATKSYGGTYEDDESYHAEDASGAFEDDPRESEIEEEVIAWYPSQNIDAQTCSAEDLDMPVDAGEVDVCAYYNKMQAEHRGVTSPAGSSNYGGATLSSQERQAKVLAAKQRSRSRGCGQELQVFHSGRRGGVPKANAYVTAEYMPGTPSIPEVPPMRTRRQEADERPDGPQPGGGCPHVNITRRGSNAYVEMETCKDCGVILKEDFNDNKEAIEIGLPSMLDETLVSSADEWERLLSLLRRMVANHLALHGSVTHGECLDITNATTLCYKALGATFTSAVAMGPRDNALLRSLGARSHTNGASATTVRSESGSISGDIKVAFGRYKGDTFADVSETD
eukprot:s980_g11.t1